VALVETIVYALIGLAVGAGALLLLPGYFPAGRGLTLATALVSALLSGGITRYVLDDGAPAVPLLSAVVCSALLVSVLARPEQAPRHRGSHRRQRPA